jgi:hypothetical protein
MTTKKVSILVGILILTAYLMLTGEFTDSKLIILFTDIISGLSVIGIPILLKPFLQKDYKPLFSGYFFLKIIEGALMILGGILFLSNSLHIYRDWIYEAPHLFTFITSGFMFYWLLYKSNLVPKFISIWGMVAIFSLFIQAVLGFIGLSHPIIEALLILIITNEVFLAFWLMIKGFNQTN